MSVTNFLKKPVFSLPARQELPNLRHFFRRLWLIFGGCALLLVLSFVVFGSIGASLEQERSSTVNAVNLLGRQRTDSQVLSRLMLQAERSTQPLQTYYLGRIDLVWGLMNTCEESIHSGTLVRHATGRQLADILKKLEEAHASYLKAAGVMKKLYPRTNATVTLLGGMGEKLTEHCDAMAGFLEQAAQKMIVVNTDINEHLTLLNWLQMAVTGGITLGTALLLTRGQISTMERLIDTSLRVQELTYLQNAVLESAACGIISMNTKGLIATFNCGAEKLTGYSRQEVVGSLTPELFHDSPELERMAGDLARETGMAVAPGFDIYVAYANCGIIRERECSYVRKDGSRVAVSLSMTCMLDDDGEVTGFLGIVTDVTEKKKLEQQFLRAQRLESVGTLAGGIAHDLNNVLTPILMSIELLRLTHTNERTLAILGGIEASARRGADLVRQILTFARGVEGKRTELHAGPLIKDIQHFVQDTFPKNIHCISSLPEDLPSFLGDATQLHQILLNLCVNARDAMPGGGTIAITARSAILDEAAAAKQMDAKPGAYVMLSVSDTGSGIPHEVVDKIFDPFFTTKEVGKGTGLGLSTVLSITKSHGGFVTVTSEPGQETTFTICLPAVPNTGRCSLPPPAQEQPPVQEQPMPHGNGELILIVDDEEAIRTTTRQTLEALDYRTLVAADGVEAVALYSQHNAEIAVVLTDMMMPVMDGPATIQMLQRINPDVKIIASSGVSHLGGPAKVAEMGVRHFLPKPYSAQTVMTTLSLVLNQADGWEETPVKSMTL
ncbi:ATP-binding protein [Prosthecobacter sp.]|uniref:hybrid sensor histidine kinase/response regulator n=1 Tax=Prosthecobacter sp. TaxID=1965333 RepID=UPI003783C351